MTAWSDDALQRIASVDEITIAPLRADGALRDPTIVWVVRVGSDLFVRAARSANTGWHGVARTSRQARIDGAGIRKDVAVDDADDAVLDRVDNAYRGSTAATRASSTRSPTPTIALRRSD